MIDPTRDFGISAASDRRTLRFKWTVLGIVLAIGAVITPMLMSIHKFLAVSSPIGEGILVVEAWIPRQTLAESVHTFDSGHYRYVIVVGGPIEGNGSVSAPSKTYDEIAAKELEKLGLDPEKLVRITVPSVEEGYRTLASAEAVKRWLRCSQSAQSVDVFTAGVHARKSWALFRYALGGNYRVGIISGPEYVYNARFWFLSATGIWYVVRNFVGFVYSKFWIPLNTKVSARLAKFEDLVSHRAFPILANLSQA